MQFNCQPRNTCVFMRDRGRQESQGDTQLENDLSGHH